METYILKSQKEGGRVGSAKWQNITTVIKPAPILKVSRGCAH